MGGTLVIATKQIVAEIIADVEKGGESAVHAVLGFLHDLRALGVIAVDDSPAEGEPDFWSYWRKLNAQEAAEAKPEIPKGNA